VSLHIAEVIKYIMNKTLLLFVAILFGMSDIIGQSGTGGLKGKISDKDKGEALPFVNIVLLKNGANAGGGVTDFSGEYSIKPLEPGVYTIKVSSVGYGSKNIEGVVVKANKTTFLNIPLASGVDLDAIEIVKYTVPIIDKDNTASGETMSKEQLTNIAGRSVTAIAQTTAGVSTEGTGGGVSIRGSRTGGNFVYIDGVKVRGADNLPKSAIQQVSVITGGLPANYGDATGGIISITTKGPSAQYYGGAEALTSGLRFGDEVRGFDNFGQSILEASISGPLISTKNDKGEKKPILGFVLSGNYTRTEDPVRSSNGVYYITDEARDELIETPLRRSDNGLGNGVGYNTDFSRLSDFENVATARNAGNTQVTLAGKIDVKTSPTVNLSVGGRMSYVKGNNFSRAGSLYNPEENTLRTDLDYSFNARFSQRFTNSKEDKSLIKNAYYTVMVDYSKVLRRTEHERHGENFFDYGYVGAFDLYKDTNQYVLYSVDGNPHYYRQEDLPGDTLVVFTPGTKNPLLANYTSAYFDLFDETEGNYDKLDNLTNRGLRNGDGPTRAYGIWNNIGMPSGTFQKFDNSQFRVSASGSADIGDHAIQLGFEYEQRTDRGYTLGNLVTNDANRGGNIWALMRNYTNFHLKNLERGDSTISYRDSQYPYVSFDTKVDLASQRTFDRRLRDKLGLDPNGDDIINVDALDPSVLSIDLFSAEDLLNNGNRLVNYYGYDPYGNKTTGKTTLNDYFTARDAEGNLTRAVGAFEPIYFAGYIMDKFEFEDLIFNVGVRVDRYDANQSVLRDKYIMAEARTVADMALANGAIKEAYDNRPSNIGEDFAVYVDNVDSPKNVVGYRDGDTFYDANGNVVNPKSGGVSGNNGEVSPWLENPNEDGLNAKAFEDYTPQINVMPRISFSFPISDEALFFAHYDILTRRPVSANRIDIMRYERLEKVGSSSTNPITNPNLKPEQTIDYEIGFQQKLTASSGLKISAFYRENRDQIQIFQNVGAYPQDYFSYDNLDFGTVKGLTVGYDMRRTGNIYMRLNYTLQFADGTGSSAGGAAVNLNNTDFSTLRTISPLNYDQRHRINANIDYHYGEGKSYNGPKIGEKDILANAGANFVFNLGSGTPYSASSDSRNQRLDGSINGSRKPWTFRIDATFDKTFKVNYGQEKKKSFNVNAYLLINNLLNTRNITGVYANTGNPEDDGYLSDPDYQTVINDNEDVQSFQDLYSLNLTQAGRNFSSPRTIQLGVRIDF
jgi:outer membrane receptor protein involved in Fe transport